MVSGRFYHGADDELRGLFWDLAQIGEGGEPKYSAYTLHRLAARVLDGRAHERLVFRLCHLVRCAVLAAGGAKREGGWLEFFCAPEAGRASWAGAYLRARLTGRADGRGAGLDARIEAAEDHAALWYPGREEPVSLAYGGIPLLAAFMELLLNVLHYRALRDAFQPLAKPDLTWRELQDTANALSRSVYAWLREHTRPVQESRDFEAIAGFLVARAGAGAAGGEGGDGDFSAEDVDDEAVLAFWCEVSAAPDSEFRTYRKTFRAFLRFTEAMREEAARAAFERPLPIGTDRGAGERDPADPGSLGLGHMNGYGDVASGWDHGAGRRVYEHHEEHVEEEVPALEALSDSRIKFLLARESDLLRLIDAHPRLLPRLARSFVRDRCFGHAQGRISQAFRKDRARVPALVSAPPEITCEGVVGGLEKIRAYLDDLVAAAGYVLLAGDGGGEEGASRVLDFEKPNRGRRALDGIRRQGFDEVRARAPDSVEAFRQAVPAIIALRERLSVFCGRLEAQAPWALRQAEDEPVFRGQFARIYPASMREGGEEP